MHFYDIKGNPRHTVKTQKGAKNPTRASRVSDAIKHKWLPSSTGILDVVDKEWLRRHTAIECVKAAMQRPPIHEEDHQELAEQIVNQIMQESGQAADIGTNIHNALDAWVSGKPYPRYLSLYGGLVVPMSEVIDPVIEILQDYKPVRTEFVTVNPELGYAGTVDKEATRCHNFKDVAGIIDYKSKKTKKGEKIKPSETHPMQLASYHASVFNPGKLPHEIDWTDQWAANIYISTTEPGRTWVKVWTPEELSAAFGGFCACLDLWRYLKGYDPRSNTEDVGSWKRVRSRTNEVRNGG